MNKSPIYYAEATAQWFLATLDITNFTRLFRVTNVILPKNKIISIVKSSQFFLIMLLLLWLTFWHCIRCGAWYGNLQDPKGTLSNKT